MTLYLFPCIFLVVSAAVVKRKEVCDLDSDAFNQILGSTVDRETFGVEPAMGLGVEQYGGTGVGIEAAVEAVLAKNSSLSRARLEACLEAHYLVAGRRPPIPHTHGSHGNPLEYHTPWYLGGSPAVGVPVPDDEEYKPGADGYTTYINPYNFKQKVQSYSPTPLFYFPNPFKFLSEAYKNIAGTAGNLTIDYSEEGDTNEDSSEWYLLG